MNPLHRFMSTLALVARFPVPLRSKPDYGSVAFFLPLVGLHAGLLACAGAFLGLALFGPGLLAALCAILAQYLAYNLFHFDGLLDTADAAGAFGDQEKRRAILKDPRIGAFAMFVGFMILAARMGALSDLFMLARSGLKPSGSPDTGLIGAVGTRASLLPWAALLLAPPVGRLAAIVVTLSSSPASTKGLAASLGSLSPVAAILGFALAASPAALLAGILWGPLGAALSLLAGALIAMLTGILVGLWYGRTIGGYNGDAMGAAVELGEVLVLLLVLAAGRILL
jgi:adenosylcobinamide-GDP ribazoletransferase